MKIIESSKFREELWMV